jgi:hypothetical protein
LGDEDEEEIWRDSNDVVSHCIELGVAFSSKYEVEIKLKDVSDVHTIF